DAAQQLIADAVPERVVDQLKAVEIEKKRRQALLAAPGLKDGEVQPVVEEQAIGKASERVVESQVFDLFLGSLALGDVDQGAFDDVRLSIRSLDEARVLQNPDEASIPAAKALLEVRKGLPLLQAREGPLPVYRG